MTVYRAISLGLLACVALAMLTPMTRANPAPPPDIIRKRDNPTPQIDPETGATIPVKDPPRRSGPFRSCGSGMGLGLAGIGLAWGLMWAGTRYAGRVARPRS